VASTRLCKTFAKTQYRWGARSGRGETADRRAGLQAEYHSQNVEQWVTCVAGLKVGGSGDAVRCERSADLPPARRQTGAVHGNTSGSIARSRTPCEAATDSDSAAPSRVREGATATVVATASRPLGARTRRRVANEGRATMRGHRSGRCCRGTPDGAGGVKKTGRCLVVQEAPLTGRVAAGKSLLSSRARRSRGSTRTASASR